MKLVITTLFSLIALHPLFAQTITIARSGTQPSRPGPVENFTGTVRVDPLFAPTGGNRAAGSLVTFDAGAHSAWHTHPTGQVLIVTAGTGRVQQWGQPIDEIRVGDVVRIPPDVKHWHGAAPATSMAHISVVEQPATGAAVVWMEKVSAEQYDAPLRDQRPDARPAAATNEPTAAQRIMGDIAPTLADLTDRVLFGEVWARPQLSQRDRSLVTISALIAMNRPDQFRSHLARARTNGVTQEEAIEVITHLAFYSGWPNAVTAVGVAREVFANEKTQPPQ
jgi:4-carboxymuconolactone decarboxylase